MTMADAAQFLCDRLDELDFSQDMESFARDFHGHVAPALSRLKGSFAAERPGVGEGIPDEQVANALDAMAMRTPQPTWQSFLREVATKIRESAEIAPPASPSEGEARDGIAAVLFAADERLGFAGRHPTWEEWVRFAENRSTLRESVDRFRRMADAVIAAYPAAGGGE